MKEEEEEDENKEDRDNGSDSDSSSSNSSGSCGGRYVSLAVMSKTKARVLSAGDDNDGVAKSGKWRVPQHQEQPRRGEGTARVTLGTAELTSNATEHDRTAEHKGE